MTGRGIDYTGLAYLAALAVGGYVVYRLVKAGPDAARAVGGVVENAVNAINPTNPDNIFSSAANRVTQVLSGDPSASLGTKLYDIFHPDPKAVRSTFGAAALDQEDADLGRAMTTAARRGDFNTSTLDQEDADLGAAMAANSGSAYLDYSKLRLGTFRYE